MIPEVLKFLKSELPEHFQLLSVEFSTSNDFTHSSKNRVGLR
jgi:hypothetical protein